MTTSPLVAPAAGGVLVASANASLREQVQISLRDPPWQVQEAPGGADALVKLETGRCCCVRPRRASIWSGCLEPFLPKLVVLSTGEIPRTGPVQAVGTVG